MKIILIIDDQPGIRMLLSELFRREGHETILAVNGLEAFYQLEQVEPDCILLDMKMPGMTGIEVLKKIKKEWPHIPVMMMTAYGEDDLLTEAIELGAIKYFIKPFDIYEVRDAVNHIFSA